MHPLLQHINNQIPFDEEAFNEILPNFELVRFPKKHQLIQHQQYVKHQYFVLKGCLRTFLIDPAGKEHTMQFAIVNWWVSDYLSYYKEIPSIYTVECLEDCEMLKVSKTQLTTLFETTPRLETYFRKQLENAFTAFQKRILGSLTMTAEERYAAFVDTYPNIEQRVKNYQIASYLGITAESLSRIRKQRLGNLD